MYKAVVDGAYVNPHKVEEILEAPNISCTVEHNVSGENIIFLKTYPTIRIYLTSLHLWWGEFLPSLSLMTANKYYDFFHFSIVCYVSKAFNNVEIPKPIFS